jgi:diguanylate cyclase (GGDEF)-like protein
MIDLFVVSSDLAVGRAIEAICEDRRDEAIAAHFVGSISDLLQASGDRRVDVVVFDLSGWHGVAIYEAVAGIAEMSLLAPVILIGDTDDAEVEEAAKHAGAVDLLSRNELTPGLLRRVVRYAVAARRAETRLAQLRLFDPVTGLATQQLFWEILGHAVLRAKRNKDFFGVLLIEIANLPARTAASLEDYDNAIQILTDRIGGVLRGSDVIARFEHNRVAILAESMPRIEDIQIVAEKIIQELSAPIATSTGDVRINTGIGIALYPTSADSAESLISRASEALSAARTRGQDNFAFA